MQAPAPTTAPSASKASLTALHCLCRLVAQHYRTTIAVVTAHAASTEQKPWDTAPVATTASTQPRSTARRAGRRRSRRQGRSRRRRRRSTSGHRSAPHLRCRCRRCSQGYRCPHVPGGSPAAHHCCNRYIIPAGVVAARSTSVAKLACVCDNCVAQARQHRSARCDAKDPIAQACISRIDSAKQRDKYGLQHAASS